MKIPTILHPWHSISAGPQAPVIVNSIIEITKGSKAKYELDKISGLLRLDRVLLTHLTYPVHYGFIPHTLSEDNDPLDIIILCSEPLLPLSLVEAKVVGVMCMVDNGEQDDKILAIATGDHTGNAINTLEEIPAETLTTIQHFFENYKKQEEKQVTVERFMPHSYAHEIIQQALKRYQERYP